MPPQVLVASLEATLLGVASNLTAQLIDNNRKQRALLTFDAAAFARFIFYTFITSPPNYYWQLLLERLFPARTHSGVGHYQAVPQHEEIELKQGSEELGIGVADERAPEASRKRLNWLNTFWKWLLDCITIGALFNTLAFFVIIGALKGQSIDQIVERCQTDTIPLIIAGYKLWPFASVINFTLIPVEKRLVFLCAVGYAWDTYLSLIAASK